MQKTQRHTISATIAIGSNVLKKAGISSHRLDAELLVAHILKRSRTWLHAHSDTSLTDNQLQTIDACLSLRLQRVPTAYIIGHKEFYRRLFKVTPATLIPRPESETMIASLSSIVGSDTRNLLDVGTGSGCLGITAKLEFPSLVVTLSDISQAALEVARQNADTLKADVTCTQSNLLQSLDDQYDIILANLPYVDRSWDGSPELAHEPALALYASADGLELILKLLVQARMHLTRNGYLLLEADPCQHEAIVHEASDLGYDHVETNDYIVILRYKN